MRASVPALKCAPLLVLIASIAAAQDVPSEQSPPAAAGTSAAAQPPAALLPEKNLCAARADPVAVGSVQWNGWGRDLSNTRYQPEPAIRAMDVPKLALKWAFGYQAGTEFGQPTLVDGRLFVASSAGRIYALDAKSGCTYWTYDAPAGSRTAISIGELGQAKRAAIPRRLKRTLAHLDVIKAPSAAFFGDDSGAVYALDAQKGTLLWKTQVDTHASARIVGAPTLYKEGLYVAVGSDEEKKSADPNYSCCTFRGSVAALDIANGRLLWKTYTVLEEPQPTHKNSAGAQEFGPAGAAVASPPTVDPKRGVVYVGTGRSTTSLELSLTDSIAAFDLNDGKLRWVKQLTVKGGAPGRSAFTSPPVLRTLSSGNDVILAAQRSGVVYGLDPDHGGDILWQSRLGTDTDAGGIAWGAAADYRSLFVAVAGSFAQPGNTNGSLWALDPKTGIARWHTPAPTPACAAAEAPCSHAQTQAVTVMPGAVFSGSMDGHLRAYSTINGKILWDFDTVKTYQTLNAVRASGSPLDHGGATIVNGSVYVNSGNALLAFSVDGK
ncbi:MAG TPA: PQQ-binding-like beta-propeller repeat protein [Steroidobacteraceae bacterium]|jgi:polyvinyl alcohol dehydrogenase (cytochrome)|nr:PQQ-binding-like beta-propeller repeat protein [Steroidobacteraceae bacterium]